MNDQNIDIRKPAVAGLFYPKNPVELTKIIAGLYAEVEKTFVDGAPLALIVPHAGYPYSGHTAAKAYKLLEGERYDTVVVVSPSHRVFFKGSSVFQGGGYETPLGVVEVDRELSEKIASIHPSVYFSNMGHASGQARGEHALEVQLPFLQVVLGQFKLVAIVMGDQEEDSINALGETLAATLRDTNTLIIASTDLSHFHSQKRAERLDAAVQAAVEQFDPDQLMETLESGKGEACGGGIVAAVMKAARRLGANKVNSLEYMTSGQTTGDFEEVVGYLSAAIVGDKVATRPDSVLGARAALKKPDFSLNDKDKEMLLAIAREAIEAHIKDESYIPPIRENLEAQRGLFVTLKIDGQLRGCIGLIRSRDPLYKAVSEMAVAAAFEDPRFPPVTAVEFDRLEFDISVLSPLQRVRGFDDIEVGRDGLMIKLDLHSGLLLPQVATENGWNRTELLEQTCLKAGLPKNSYKNKQAEIYRFSADIF